MVPFWRVFFLVGVVLVSSNLIGRRDSQVPPPPLPNWSVELEVEGRGARWVAKRLWRHLGILLVTTRFVLTVSDNECFRRSLHNKKLYLHSFWKWNPSPLDSVGNTEPGKGIQFVSFHLWIGLRTNAVSVRECFFLLLFVLFLYLYILMYFFWAGDSVHLCLFVSTELKLDWSIGIEMMEMCNQVNWGDNGCWSLLLLAAGWLLPAAGVAEVNLIRNH